MVLTIMLPETDYSKVQNLNGISCKKQIDQDFSTLYRFIIEIIFKIRVKRKFRTFDVGKTPLVLLDFYPNVIVYVNEVRFFN